MRPSSSASGRYRRRRSTRWAARRARACASGSSTSARVETATTPPIDRRRSRAWRSTPARGRAPAHRSVRSRCCTSARGGLLVRGSPSPTSERSAGSAGGLSQQGVHVDAVAAGIERACTLSEIELLRLLGRETIEIALDRFAVGFTVVGDETRAIEPFEQRVGVELVRRTCGAHLGIDELGADVSQCVGSSGLDGVSYGLVLL